MPPATRGQQGKEQTSAVEVRCSFPESTALQLVDIHELEELEELGPRVRAPLRRARETAEPPKPPTAPTKRAPRKVLEGSTAGNTSDNTEDVLSKLYAAVLELKQDYVTAKSARRSAC